MLLDEGRSEAEVAQYFVKRMLLPEDRASSYVASLKHPLHGLHLALTYGTGQNWCDAGYRGQTELLSSIVS